MNTACTTTLRDPIGAATYDHQPIGAIPRFRSEVGSRGVRASEGFSANTTTGGSRRDDILEPHSSPEMRRKSVGVARFCQWAAAHADGLAAFNSRLLYPVAFRHQAEKNPISTPGQNAAGERLAATRRWGRVRACRWG